MSAGDWLIGLGLALFVTGLTLVAVGVYMLRRGAV